MIIVIFNYDNEKNETKMMMAFEVSYFVFRMMKVRHLNSSYSSSLINIPPD